MWEWRIFYKEDREHEYKKNPIIKKGSQNATIIKRNDLYFNLNLKNIGLKIRNYKSTSQKPLLELKILADYTAWGGEYWVKRIKTPINKKTLLKNLPSFVTGTIINYKQTDSEFSEEYQKIIEIIENEDYDFVECQKKRKQIQIPFTYNTVIKNLKQKKGKKVLITFEETKLIFVKENESNWTTIQIESEIKGALEKFVAEYLGKNKGIQAGYPEFIMKSF